MAPSNLFGRSFGNDPRDLGRFAETPWGEDLLRSWRPAGARSDDDGLRLTIRNGTLNFYRTGQSVAKVSFGRGREPQLDVHLAYVTGKKGGGQNYARLSSKGLECAKYDGVLDPYGPGTLAGWVKAANNHAGDEKKFVDKLVEHNPRIIDLEMGLPATGVNTTAPRMDLVALESDAGAPQIVFWEAKMMGNGELRCKPGVGTAGRPHKPHIVKQLTTYKEWIDDRANEDAVIEAYRNNCRLLRDLHVLAKGINPAIGHLDSLVVSVAEGARPTVDKQPRVVVSDKENNKSWTANKHDVVLEREGIQVQLVSCEIDASYVLQGRA